MGIGCMGWLRQAPLSYTAGLVPNVFILHREAARGLRRF